MRTLVDSSGWIEFFAEGPLAGRYATYLRAPAQLVTPTIVLYEVYKRLKRERGDDLALFATEPDPSNPNHSPPRVSGPVGR